MSSKPVLIALAILSFTGCNKKAEAPLPLYAVLRFENLSGDPSLDWVGRAASEVLSRELAGAMDGPVVPARAIGRLEPSLGARPLADPGSSTERSAALVAGATKLITGTIAESGGKLLVTAYEEDTASGRTVGRVNGSGASPLEALHQLTSQLGRGSHDAEAASFSSGTPLTLSKDALQAYSEALESPSLNGLPLFEKATQIDPKLGPAWVALVAGAAARGDRAGAEQILAKTNGLALDKRDRAQLDLEAANLQRDRKRALVAMRKVAGFNPGDLILQRSLAEQETAAGNDGAAAAIWKRIAGLNREDGEAWNNLAYSQAYLGDAQGAFASIQHYLDLHPNEANPLDSKGDIHYLFRQFKEAADDYLAAFNTQPGALNGGEIYKAAWARFKAGDTPGADSAFAQFRADQEKRKNPTLPLLEADWFYRTSRKKRGLDSIEKSLPVVNGPVKSLLAAQLAVWYVMEGKRETAYRTITSVPMVRDGSVISAFFVARPSASVGEWTALADRIIPPSGNNASLHDTVLAYALILDHHVSAALPIWEKLMEQQTVPDPFMRAVYLRLQGRPLDRPLLPNPLQYNEFTALIDNL